MKENFQITDKETGKVYWISRAHAVAGFIMFKSTPGGQWYFLLEKRGPGCPDNVGKWCGVCGYLNWGETRKEALVRECYEETGYRPSFDNVIELCTIDDPRRDARENIVTRYAIITTFDDVFDKIYDETINCNTLSRGGEANEVSEIKILSQDEINGMDSDEFAFGHKEIILETIQNLIEKGYRY